MRAVGSYVRLYKLEREFEMFGGWTPKHQAHVCSDSSVSWKDVALLPVAYCSSIILSVILVSTSRYRIIVKICANQAISAGTILLTGHSHLSDTVHQ